MVEANNRMSEDNGATARHLFKSVWEKLKNVRRKGRNSLQDKTETIALSSENLSSRGERSPFKERKKRIELGLPRNGHKTGTLESSRSILRGGGGKVSRLFS